MLYDLFICHASEDKDSFVRPLAAKLKEARVEVWYDEFELKLGDSIRQSIDRGLRQSRFGCVVLSHAFFTKQWTQYELDGLTEREIQGREKVLLPIWHGVGHSDVCQYSLLLAGRKAASSSRGIDAVADEIYAIIHPKGSPLIAARDFLLQWGATPPVITDEYWLTIVEASNRLPGYGADIPEQSTWGRWSFPLPEREGTPESWGRRLGWTALQHAWVAEAESVPIDITTPPDEVLVFIRSHPGLLETCQNFPELLAEYAPQLTIPGMGGELEKAFEKEYQRSCAQQKRKRNQNSTQGTALTTTGTSPACDEKWSLRHPTFGDYEAVYVAEEYFTGGMFGPRVTPFETIDHVFWLLSSTSDWLPRPLHTVLLEGLRQGMGWPWGPDMGSENGNWPSYGAMADALIAREKPNTFQWTSAVEDDTRYRIRKTIARMKLSSSEEQILCKFRAGGFVENYFTRIEAKRKKAKKSARSRTAQKGRSRRGHE